MGISADCCAGAGGGCQHSVAGAGQGGASSALFRGEGGRGMTHRLALFIHRVTQVHLTVQVDKVVISCEPEHLNRKSALRGLAILQHLNGCIQRVWTSEWEH